MVLTAVGSPDPQSRRPARTEDQVLGAMAGNLTSGLAVILDGETRFIRPLSLRAERTWKEQVAATVKKAMEVNAALDVDVESVEGIGALLGGNSDDLLDLILAYDELGGRTLGFDRDWLDSNATGVEVRNMLEVLLDSAYPPMPGAAARPGRILLGLIVAGAAAKSAAAASTSGSSPATRGSTGRRTSKKR